MAFLNHLPLPVDLILNKMNATSILTQGGIAVIEFQDCSNARFDYILDADGLDGDHNLALLLIGFHILMSLDDLVERKGPVDDRL